MAGFMVICSRMEPRCGSVAIATLRWLAFKQSLVMSMGDGPALNHYVEVCLCVRVCTRLSVCLSLGVCTCVSVCLSAYLSVYVMCVYISLHATISNTLYLCTLNCLLLNNR